MLRKAYSPFVLLQGISKLTITLSQFTSTFITLQLQFLKLFFVKCLLILCGSLHRFLCLLNRLVKSSLSFGFFTLPPLGILLSPLCVLLRAFRISARFFFFALLLPQISLFFLYFLLQLSIFIHQAKLLKSIGKILLTKLAVPYFHYSVNLVKRRSDALLHGGHIPIINASNKRVALTIKCPKH